MKITPRSIVNITRKNILLLGLVLGLVGFGLAAFNVVGSQVEASPAVDGSSAATATTVADRSENPTSILNAIANRPAGENGVGGEQESPYAGPWTAGAVHPVGISRYAFAKDGENLYVIGGITTGSATTNAVRRYNATTNVWTNLAGMPGSGEAPTAAYFNGKIYATVGSGGTGFQIYDIVTDTWAAGPAIPGFSSTYGSASGAFNGKVVVAGGDNATGGTTTVRVYDIATNTWSNGAPAPSAFQLAGYTPVGQYLYVIGGYTASAAANLNTSFRYDMVANTWSSGPVFTPQRADFALASSGSKIFAIGGDANGGGFFDSSTAVDDLNVSAWPAGTWAASPDPLPTARQANQAGYFSTGRVGGEIWSTGGFTGSFSNEHLYRTEAAACTPDVLLIEDQGGFGNAGAILTTAGFNVTVVNNEFANGYANLLNGAYLAGFDFVVYGERGNGTGSVLPAAVSASLESYIQNGGNLLVTGRDTLGDPNDTNLATLVRSSTAADRVSNNPNWQTANVNNFILNGPYGDFRNLAFVGIGYDDDVLTPNVGAGAIELASTPGVTSKIIFTDLPGAGGSVGYWNGGNIGTGGDAQPDFYSGGNPQNIFLNWAAGVGCGSCAPTTIDFESLVHADALTITHAQPYIEEGFVLEGLAGSPLKTFGTLEPRFTGSTAMFNDAINGITRLTKSGGGTFTLTSINLAELNGNSTVPVTFTGTRPDTSTVTETFTLDGIAFGQQTFNFPITFSNLSKVEWAQVADFHQFDNIVVNGGCGPPANTPPSNLTLNLSATTINENGSTSLSGTFVDPDAGDAHTVTINWGDGSAPQVLNLGAGDTTIPATAHTYLDDNPSGTASDNYTINVTVADAGGNVAGTRTVTVNNVAPSAIALSLSATTINENGSTSLSGTFVDPGTLDPHTVTINWGDGSPVQTLATLPAGVTAIPSTAHTYLDDNPTGTSSDVYTITVTVTDDDTGTANNTTSVTVNNVAPSAVILSRNPATINEGQSTALSGSFTDPGTLDTHTVTINWGDGSAPQVLTLLAGVTTIPSTPHTYLDDNPVGTPSDIYTITVIVSDDDSGVARPAEGGELIAVLSGNEKLSGTRSLFNNTEPSNIVVDRTAWSEARVGEYTRKNEMITSTDAPEVILPGVTATTTMGSGFGTVLANTVNGVGLNSVSLSAVHDPTIPTNSWVSSGTLTGTITFNLNGPRTLLGFSFWNQNNGGPGALGITGIRGVAVSSSLDGTTFTPIPGGPTQFAQVTGNTSGPEVISFAPVNAAFVRFTVTTNWGDAAQTGFAEVQFNAATTTTVTVNNVNPTATFTNGGPYVVGQPGTVTFSNQADASASDLAGLRYSYDLDNNGTFDIGNGTYAGSVTASSAVFPPKPAPGSYTVRGRVIDDDTGFTDYTTVVQVQKANTTTTVTAVPASPSTFGQAVTFTATVAAAPPGAGTPTGTVTFNIDGNLYCVNTPLTNQGGFQRASCTQAGLPALPAGLRNVVAIYNGDTNFNGSAGTLNYTVNKANTTTTITSDDPDPSLVNQPYTVTWTVVANPVQVNSGTPTGTVTVNGGTGGGSCTAAVSAGGCQLTPTTIGVKTIQATYNGDANFNGSVSATTTHTVNVGISGTVRNGVTMTPVAGVPMVLLCASPAQTNTTTNAAGQFTFTGPFTGPCRLYPNVNFSEPFERVYPTLTTNVTDADFLVYGNATEFPRKISFPTQYVAPGVAGTMPVIMQSQDNEASVAFSFTYDTNPFSQPPVVVCGANAPGCTIVNNTSIFGRVGFTVTPAAGGFSRPDGTPLEAPEAAGPKEIARINFLSVATNLPSTDFGVPQNTPTAFSIIEKVTNNPLTAVFVVPARVVFAQGLEGDVAGRNAGSGTFEAADVVQMRRFISGLDTPVATHNEFQRADTAPAATKGNGTLDATDLVQTRRYVAGLDASQSAGGSGAPNPGSIAPPAGESATSEITLGDGQATNNSRVSIPVRMRTNGNEVAASFTIRYDERRFGEPFVTLANGAPEGAVLTFGKSEPGVLHILIDSTVPFTRSTDAQLVDITFDVKEEAASGSTAITVEDLVFSDAAANATRSRAIGSTVNIAGPNPTDDSPVRSATQRNRRIAMDLVEEWLDTGLAILRPREPGEQQQRTITRSRIQR